MRGIAERVTVVVGAASGMGASAASALAVEGAKVALLDVNLPAVRELADRLQSTSAAVRSYEIDISNVEHIRRTIDAVARDFGHIDSLLHFAGLFDDTSFPDLEEERWNQVLDVNLKGVFFTCQSVVRHIHGGGSGAVVLVASDSARAGSTVSGPAYAASKGGVIALTHALGKLLGPTGIRVNAICPGLTATPMSESWDPDVVERARSATPLGRLGEPEDMADVAMFLISDHARYITGEVVEVNGGSFID